MKWTVKFLLINIHDRRDYANPRCGRLYSVAFHKISCLL